MVVSSASAASTAVRWVLIALAGALVLWVRVLPLALDGVPEAEQFRYHGEDGREHVYLGDIDSYFWLRQARDQLRTGTRCEAVVGDECRDVLGNAPVGRRMPYARSLHVTAIVWLHRAIRTVRPGYPLPASAFWVSVLIGVLGTVPAFLLGERLAGPLGGFGAAVLVGTSPFVLQRSLGSDNDVWNVVLPLAVVASAAAATAEADVGRQVAYAAVAAAFVGLHAAVWSGWVFTYLVTAFGLFTNALTRVLRVALRGWRRRPAEAGALRRGLVPLLVFCPAAAVFVALAGASGGLAVALRAAAALRSTLAPEAAPRVVPGTAWPDVLATVSELRRPGLAGIAAMAGQPLYFFAGWLGLLLLWLPRSRWRNRHLAVMIGGTLLYYFLLMGPPPPPSQLVALLAVPIVVGVAVAVTASRHEVHEAGAAFLVTVWFLAALKQSYEGARFVLLLVAPAAVACGVAIGRLHLWLSRGAVKVAGGRRSAWATALFVLVGATLVMPVERGIATARRYVPEMTDAWWDTLAHIREAAPRDAIVNTWWDYGHWTTYVAERGTSADGASLLTHVPYWLARALMAPSEPETVGLLRMLNCGSDATPEPEGLLGAYGKLVGAGLDDAAARTLVLELGRRDRSAARTLLAERGLASLEPTVLASTHCRPPPAYLVLGSRLAGLRAIRQLAAWDFVRPGTVPASPSTPLVAGIPPAWSTCMPTNDEWLCAPPEDAAWGGRGTFRYRPSAPEESSFDAPFGEAGPQSVPRVIRLAEVDGVRDVRPDGATDPEVGVLVDLTESRVLVGPPDLVRSTLVQLLYLDGRSTTHFEKFDARVSPSGERVATWRIRDDS
jgi:asparagine N-glycosylation enzyme membrane subunit Stt3